MKNFITIILICLASTALSQCLDTLRFVDPAPGCPLDFIPICGCNGVTYRNSCFAEAATVIQYSDGPCEQVAVSFYPNPVTNWLFTTLVTKFESDVQLYIYDRNGNIYYNRYLRNVTYEYLTIPVNDFDDGLYVLVVQSGGELVFEKFIKWNQ